MSETPDTPRQFESTPPLGVRGEPDVLRVGDRLLFSFGLLREMVIQDYLREGFPDPQFDKWTIEVVEIRRHGEHVELVVKRHEPPA